MYKILIEVYNKPEKKAGTETIFNINQNLFTQG